VISFICWKWRAEGNRRAFSSEHVNVLYRMVARFYSKPFRFICITDEAFGLDEPVEAMPMPVRFDAIQNPSGARFPNCYCRLWNFSRQAAALLGARICQLDIDLVITGELEPLIDREEDFVGWTDERFGWKKIAGGIYLLRTGAFTEIWDEFDPVRSPLEAFAAGFAGSDQGWMSYRMFPPAGQWSASDGLVKINWTPAKAKTPPAGARVVFTSGVKPPWNRETRKIYPWIDDHWR
jgi:hypothetical protein